MKTIIFVSKRNVYAMAKYTVFKRFVIMSFLSIQIGLHAQSRLSLCYWPSVIPQVERYDNSLDSILQTRLGDDYLFRFTVVPSFDPEYALQIELVGEQYYLKAISFDKNLWYAKDVAIINIDECSVEMETKLAEQVLLVSRQFIENRIDSVSLGGVIDGNLYQFVIKDKDSIQCGQIQQPDHDYPLDNMCKLCAQLKDWCLAENKSEILIEEEINRLLIKLNSEGLPK